jgi:hypothetical protein
MMMKRKSSELNEEEKEGEVAKFKTGVLSFAIDEFPRMDESAIERYWNAKIKRRKGEREQIFANLVAVSEERLVAVCISTEVFMDYHREVYSSENQGYFSWLEENTKAPVIFLSFFPLQKQIVSDRLLFKMYLFRRARCSMFASSSVPCTLP